MTKNLRALVRSDLERAQRLVRRTGDEIDAQFRIATPEGDIWIGITMGDDEEERKRRLGLVSDFMVSWLSTGFVMAAQIEEPEAVFAAGVTVRECVWCLSRITRSPLGFEEVEWPDVALLGEELPGLLPKGRRYLSAARSKELEEWFGPHGRYPGVFLEDIRRLGRGTEEFGPERLSV